MDGNGRWAQLRGLPRQEGHRQGAKAVLVAVESALILGVKDLTLFAFSTENWNRPPEEVSFLMDMLSRHLRLQRKRVMDLGVRYRVLGKVEPLSEKLKKALLEVENASCGNSRITVRLALNYGGRREITDAAKEMLRSSLKPEEVNENSFSQFLYHPDLCDIDLLIRTGGEFRISNFLLWQCAYAELYFTPVLWPDFSYDDFNAAVKDYAQRKRRFGRV
ncbi:MAG: polyprenyl diphosphate synthase, partial [Planctomycetota bacterium]|nr:polyprenyl diphosphate synthase [Planctomycetota bacterium]